jgi:hypothetical protein
MYVVNIDGFYHVNRDIRYEVLMKLNMMAVFNCMALCHLMDVYHYFRRICYLHSTLPRVEAASSSGLFVNTYHPTRWNAQENSYLVRFELFTAVTMNNAIFWDVMPCGSCFETRFLQEPHIITVQNMAFLTVICILLWKLLTFNTSTVIIYNGRQKELG